LKVMNELKAKVFLILFLVTTVFFYNKADGRVFKSLDQELTGLVAGTEPYLVTVKGNGGWRNLIATGIVYDQRGYAITSSQVYEAKDFEVTFKNGVSYPAAKIGVDYFSGLAVLKISGKSFTIPKQGKASDLNKGAWIAVVGNSYGMPATVNFGNYDSYTEEGLLQLSVNASPGASGGAVLNTDGEIVGVLVARRVDARPHIAGQNVPPAANFPTDSETLDIPGTPSGKCYAVPMETVRDIANQIIKDGRVRRGFLGIVPQSIPGPKSGLIVVEVDSGSAASKAGILKNDVIISVDSTRIDNRESLYRLIRSHQPGDTLSAVIFRKGRQLKISVVLGEAKDELFMGQSKLTKPPLNISRPDNLSLPPDKDLQSEVIRMKGEIERLRGEVNRLKEELRKQQKN
jgi:serine protease Do